MKTPVNVPYHLRMILGMSLCLALAPVGLLGTFAAAQATAAAASQTGTVKAISGTTLTIVTAAGQQFTIDAAGAEKILQIEPGSKDLTSAKVIQLSGIGVGDHVLVSGKAGAAPTTITATRLILMKAADLAQEHAAEQADWQRNGSGGIVSAVDPGTGTVTVAAGTRKIQVQTSGTTIFRRYASDSVKFEDAKSGTLAQLHPGDQMRVRGTKSPDGMSIAAKEIVSGTFTDVAGLLSAVDAAAGTVTLKDLTTKKTVTVKITANSDLRALPPATAAMFVTRARGQGGAPGGPGRQGGAPQGGGGQGSPQGGQGGPQAGGQGGPGGQRGQGGGARNMDLSQMMSQFPTTALNALKKGDAVMIVASQSDPTNNSLTAITMLSGVEAILTAAPTTTLGPVGGGGGEGGAGGGEGGGFGGGGGGGFGGGPGGI